MELWPLVMFMLAMSLMQVTVQDDMSECVEPGEWVQITCQQENVITITEVLLIQTVEISHSIDECTGTSSGHGSRTVCNVSSAGGTQTATNMCNGQQDCTVMVPSEEVRCPGEMDDPEPFPFARIFYQCMPTTPQPTTPPAATDTPTTTATTTTNTSELSTKTTQADVTSVDITTQSTGTRGQDGHDGDDGREDVNNLGLWIGVVIGLVAILVIVVVIVVICRRRRKKHNKQPCVEKSLPLTAVSPVRPEPTAPAWGVDPQTRVEHNPSYTSVYPALPHDTGETVIQDNALYAPHGTGETVIQDNALYAPHSGQPSDEDLVVQDNALYAPYTDRDNTDDLVIHDNALYAAHTDRDNTDDLVIHDNALYAAHQTRDSQDGTRALLKSLYAPHRPSDDPDDPTVHDNNLYASHSSEPTHGPSDPIAKKKKVPTATLR